MCDGKESRKSDFREQAQGDRWGSEWGLDHRTGSSEEKEAAKAGLMERVEGGQRVCNGL